MAVTESQAPVVTEDNWPPDQWHPIYDSVKAWLSNEAAPPTPGTPPIRSRNKRKVASKR